MEKPDIKEVREQTRWVVHRAQRAIWFNALAILCLALFAIWIARSAQRHATLARQNAAEARAARQRAQSELGKAHLQQARAERLSRASGRRDRALAALTAAGRVLQDSELRHEAVATLASYDLGEVEVWQTESSIYAGPSFSADLSLYLISSGSAGFDLRRTHDGGLLHRFDIAEGLGGGLGISPDGRWISSYTLTGEWMIWESDTRELRWKFPASMQWSYALKSVFSPDSMKFVVCLRDGTVAVHDLEDGNREIHAFGLAPTLARMSPDGARLAVAGRDLLMTRGLAEGVTSVGTRFESAIADLDWHPDGERLAVSLDDGLVAIYDLRTGVRRELRGHSVNTPLVQFHPRGEILVSASWDGTTRFWDASTGQALFQTRDGMALGFDRSGGLLAFQREGQGFGVWRMQLPVGLTKIMGPLKSRGRLMTVALHPDDRHLVFGDDEEWYLGSLETRRLLHREPSMRLRSLLFTGHGDRLVVSGGEGLRIHGFIETELGARLTPLELPGIGQETGPLERASSTADGRRLVTGGLNKGFVLDAESLVPEFRFGEGCGLLTFVALSPDNRWVVASAWKGAGVCVWNRETQEYVRQLAPESSFVDFDPQNRWLVTSNHRGYQLWQPGTWNLIRSHEVDVGSYAPGPARFSPDGSILAVAPRRDTIELVEPTTGHVDLRLRSPEGVNVTWFDFSRDGKRLAAATEESSVHLWDLGAIRESLEDLALNTALSSAGAHSDEDPASAGVVEGVLPGNLSIGLILAGMGLAVFFGARSLIHQRHQLRSQARLEELAEAQQHQLLAVELELQQSQKMQALGTLAASVAHDFNNLLSVISLSNGFLKRGTTDWPELSEETMAIEQAVAQGRQVVQSMLAYSRAGKEVEQLDLCSLVEDAVGLLGRQFLRGIRLTLDLDRQVPTLRANPGRIEQILLNLIVNAGEAMDGQGKLLIRIQARSRDNLQASVLRPAEADHYAELLVSDDGPGIPEDFRARVFEPFFTTKRNGARQGTGLGLSSVYAIAQREGYGIDLESAVGKGSTFRVTFPVEPARQMRSSQQVQLRLGSCNRAP